MTIAIIAGMALITFLFRFSPLLLVRHQREENKMNAMLENLPLSVLSALIVPGIFQVDPGAWSVGIVSAITAVILVLTPRVPLLVVILGSVTTAVLMKILTLYL